MTSLGTDLRPMVGLLLEEAPRLLHAHPKLVIVSISISFVIFRMNGVDADDDGCNI